MPNLTMFDGPVANLPKGADAYAGYVNRSGIGITWPEVSALPAKYHLSITTDGSSAMCADIEKGAMTTWKGYTVGYCSVANVNSMIKQFGRPDKLWTAHTGRGEHICGPTTCNYGGNLVTAADGTQWNSPGGYDQSILLPNFFDFLAPPTPPWIPSTAKEKEMLTKNTSTVNGGGYWGVRANANVYTFNGAEYIGPHATWAQSWGIGTVTNPVTGIAADGAGGFALLCDGADPSQPHIYDIPADGRYKDPKPA